MYADDGVRYAIDHLQTLLQLDPKSAFDKAVN